MRFNRLSLAAAAVVACAAPAGAWDVPKAGPTANVQLVAADGGLGAAYMYAVIKADGSLSSGSGVTSVTRIAMGQYEVLFDRSVRDCGATSATGGINSSTVLYMMRSYVSFVTGKPNAFLVDTLAMADNSHKDANVHLLVMCGQ